MARDAEGFNTELVRVAITGTVYVGPPGSEMPEPGEPAGPEFVPLGVFDDEGVEHEFSEDTEEVTSWQRGVVRVIVTGRSLTLKLSALESSPAVLKAFYGATPVIDAARKAVTIDIKSSVSRPIETYLFEWQDGDERMWRMLIGSGQVSEVESPKFSSSAAVAWGMTLKALGGRDLLAQWQIVDAEFSAEVDSDDPEGIVGADVKEIV